MTLERSLSPVAWKADSLQGVIFTTPGEPQLDAAQVWNLVADGLPETVQRPAAVPNALSIAAGGFHGHRLTIQSQLGRIDLTLSSGTPPADNQGPPQISDYEAALGQLGELVTKALAATKPIRTAVVAELAHVLESDEMVAQFLSDQTGGIWFPAPSQDALYQINSRTNYVGESEFSMNRIVLWSGSTYQMFTASMFGGLPGGFSQTGIVYGATLKIDVNSATSADISTHAEIMIAANFREVLAIARGGLRHLRQ